MSLVLNLITKLEGEGKSDPEIIAAVNDKIHPIVDSRKWSAVEVKRQFTAMQSGVWLMQLKGYAGVIPGQPPTPLPAATVTALEVSLGKSPGDGLSLAEEAVFRGIIQQELAQLSGVGLDLSDPGTNAFLRQAGLTELADLGIKYKSTWEMDGKTGVMGSSYLSSIRIDRDREALKSEVLTQVNDTILPSVKSGRTAVLAALDAAKANLTV